MQLKNLQAKKNKKIITRWSNTSLEQKLSVIDLSNKINIYPLMIALQAIYDDGSEALHGTIYGCLFHFGAFEPGVSYKKRSDMCDQHRKNLTMIFFIFCCLLSELNIYIAKNCSLTDILKLAESTYDQIKHTMNLCSMKS